jgi:hypothetical protein
MKIAGSKSGSEAISQRHGSANPDPDPHQNVMDPQHWKCAVLCCRMTPASLSLYQTIGENVGEKLGEPVDTCTVLGHISAYMHHR